MKAEQGNRIDSMFREKRGNILSIYMTAGYPGPDDTVAVLKALQRHGADMVEIGIPFSDPLADGPVIQGSSQVALEGGMSLAKLFSQLEGIRKEIHIPLVLMGYLNPVLQYGMDAFLEKCVSIGVDGIILPDLPPEEYAARYKDRFDALGIHHILLITPQSSEKRIRRIAGLSGGFLYMVADSSTTGARRGISAHQLAYFRRIAAMELPLPSLVGFGISSHESFMTACSHARGAIIGSAFIKALEGEADLEGKVAGFLDRIKAR